MPISPPERSIRISLSGCWERTGNSVMRLVLPRLYVILDATLLKNSPYDCAEELAAAGVRLLQYRDKSACARDLLETSRQLVSSLNSYGSFLVVNDRPDVAALAWAAGGYAGRKEFRPEHARAGGGDKKRA